MLYQICQKYINLSEMFNRHKVWFLLSISVVVDGKKDFSG